MPAGRQEIQENGRVGKAGRQRHRPGILPGPVGVLWWSVGHGRPALPAGAGRVPALGNRLRQEARHLGDRPLVLCIRDYAS
jgi:hypothetical protein